MHSIRSSCQAALRSSSEVCIFANGSRRAFSISSARSKGALPVFLTPSNSELSSLLSTFNSKVLLPYHLTKEQQELVYSQANKAKLEAEPVDITLGDVTLPLEHINRLRLPKRWPTFKQIVTKSETRDDWENVVRALEGFQNAGIEVKTDRKEMVIRYLNANGMQHLVLKALQRPKATGLSMREGRVLLAVLRGIHDMAALADWDEEQTSKALRWAKQVAELLEEEDHHATQSRGELVSEKDLRGKPAVVAVPTEMAAVLADRYGGSVEDVKVFAGRLVSALKQDNYSSSLDKITESYNKTAADFTNRASQQSHTHTIVFMLLEPIFVYNALKNARKVLGDDMPMKKDAQQWESRTETVLKEAAEAADRLRTRDGNTIPNGYVENLKNALKQIQ
ncbi:hypothetical protein FB567DRAFT_122708 [Paraphoma chrysanthemicola]|uniref:Uncharacterized protein n=1 Tax=Paraphoma chrysanthemicola TaxID=798071 RepID=A0A8K0QYT6_9PLEO|nr:hypothetical protein FB567DRAFT_122708 [Paraphoma chrysanthemicola]